MPTRRDLSHLLIPAFASLALLLIGCSNGGGSHSSPAAPTFTSSPVVQAEEGMVYTYAVAATSADGSPVTFALSSAPKGATLSGNTISWTPTHAESRVASAFSVTATTAAGGSSTQTWSVTPNGTVVITAVTTYWEPDGTTSALPTWLANVPYPAALVPQSNGAWQRLPGTANADGSFSIPNVAGGYDWLQMNPNANFWTSTSDFDYGEDLVGRRLTTTAQSTTTFNSSVSGIISSTTLGDYFLALTDLHSSVSPADGFIPADTSTFNSNLALRTDLDWSTVTSLYLSQYRHIGTNSFTGYVLGASETLGNVSFTNGATNTITGTLSAGSTASLPLSIAGKAWADLAAATGPGNPTPAVSDFSAFVEPYISGRSATTNATTRIGPAFTLLRPSASTGLFPTPLPYACGIAVSVGSFPSLGVGNPPIVTDADFGTITYDDPYPPTWQHNFQYCQLSNLTLQRPNSAATDTFRVGTSQITPLPNGPVTPILSSAQSPTVNGGSLFNSATLNTTNVTLSWNPPAVGHPFGYFVVVYQLVTTPSGLMGYGLAGGYGTAKTSVDIPFLSANNIYVFSITAMADEISNMEMAPLRHQVPTARSAVISAPFMIAAGAAPGVK